MTDRSDVRSEALTVEICSACGAMAGQSAHGHSDGRPWEWRRVEYVPLAEVERLREAIQAALKAGTWPEMYAILKAASDITALPEVERLRALLKWAHDLDKFQGEFPPIRWYDEVARYFKGQAPSDLVQGSVVLPRLPSEDRDVLRGSTVMKWYDPIAWLWAEARAGNPFPLMRAVLMIPLVLVGITLLALLWKVLL